MSDERLRELERSAGESPEAQRNYLSTLDRSQGFYPPAVIHDFPITRLYLQALCGNEYARLCVEMVEVQVVVMGDALDRQANENYIVTATQEGSVRRLARLAGAPDG